MRHNPRQPKAAGNSIPLGAGNFKMEKKVVHRLLIPFAHAAPINHDDMHLPKIVHDKNLP
jgi:hypothetical protein